MPIVRVLIADDSPTVRFYLSELLKQAEGFEVIGVAKNGLEALELTRRLHPHIVSMDINMPEMDGLEATRQIMEHCPVPVLVVSSMLEHDVELSLNALKAGALAVVSKPPAPNHPDFESKKRQLLSMLGAMADVKVISRKRRLNIERESKEFQAVPLPHRNKASILAIGASTGGPSALHHVLGGLPADFSLPIVVVQHMPNEFIAGLARWLDRVTSLSVSVAEEGQFLEAGKVLISPGGAHLTVVKSERGLKVRLVPENGNYRYQPSIDMLFRSVAMSCSDAAIGLILTGMGDDGAQGLLAMRQAGAHTLAQDASTSTVFGMPNVAQEKGAVQQMVPLGNIPDTLLKLI
ncbi:chemotaxis response regulator protein-glutamate methylesterase [Anaerolineales bacterium]